MALYFVAYIPIWKETLRDFLELVKYSLNNFNSKIIWKPESSFIMPSLMKVSVVKVICEFHDSEV